MKRTLKLGAMFLGITALLCACGNHTAGNTETAEETAAGTEAAENTDESVYAFEYMDDDLVTLGEYKGLKYTVTDTSVSEEEVDAQIQRFVEYRTTHEQITDRAAENGDTVNIDYEGLIDGEAFQGGTDTGYRLVLGSHSFIDGFEDGLVGVTPGKEVALNLTFPDPYPNNPDMAGKEVVFNVTINYIQGADIVPEVNDEFVASFDIENVHTVEEFRNYIRGELQAKNESDAEAVKQNELTMQAAENAQFGELPEELIAQYASDYADYMSGYIYNHYGVDLEQYLSLTGSTQEEFDKTARESGEEQTKIMLTICAIAKAEGINIDELYDSRTAEYAEKLGYADIATLEADYGKNYLKQAIISEEALKVLTENAVGVESLETQPSETETTSETTQK